MQIKVLPLSRWKGSEQGLVVFAAEDHPTPMGWKGGEAALKKILAQAKEEGFRGKPSQVVALHPESSEPARRLYLAGVGSLQGLGEEAFRRAIGQASKVAARTAAKGLSVLFPEKGEPQRVRRIAKAIAEGGMLAQYRFGGYKSAGGDDPKPLENLVILHGESGLSDVEAGAAVGEAFGKAAALARDLANEPPSVLSPAKLAERVSKMGGKVRGKTYDAKALERMGMGGIAGVGRGSANPPVLIHLRYQGSKPKAKLALVGKGVTFDSGGLCLKNSKGMLSMKADMAGAATVAAVMRGADMLKLPVQIDGFIPAVENMPSGSAIKPGDVVKSYNGRTIEVANTDAEGRLILADALAYAVREKPDHVIDCATLTGAVLSALGDGVAGIMGTDNELVNSLIAAGEVAGEPMWRMPLVKDYEDHIKSSIADVKNIGREGKAGTIIGGLFLKGFVGKASWAHLDIAGVAYTDEEQPYCPAGATGVPVRALLTYLLKLTGL